MFESTHTARVHDDTTSSISGKRQETDILSTVLLSSEQARGNAIAPQRMPCWALTLAIELTLTLLQIMRFDDVVPPAPTGTPSDCGDTLRELATVGSERGVKDAVESPTGLCAPGPRRCGKLVALRGSLRGSGRVEQTQRWPTTRVGWVGRGNGSPAA